MTDLKELLFSLNASDLNYDEINQRFDDFELYTEFDTKNRTYTNNSKKLIAIMKEIFMASANNQNETDDEYLINLYQVETKFGDRKYATFNAKYDAILLTLTNIEELNLSTYNIELIKCNILELANDAKLALSQISMFKTQELINESTMIYGYLDINKKIQQLNVLKRKILQEDNDYLMQ